MSAFPPGASGARKVSQDELEMLRELGYVEEVQGIEAEEAATL